MFGRLLRKDVSPQKLPGIVAPIAERHGVKRVWLFGSRARGDHGRNSDYDFCILMEKGSSLLDVIAFSNELEETLGREVDIAYENHMSDHFRQRVERDRLLIYEA